MEPTEKNLSAQESLDIITAMIQQAKGNVQRNSFYFLLWGWVVTLANLGMYALLQLEYQRPYLVWVITIPAWLLSMYRAYRTGSERKQRTLLEQITIWTWISFSITIFIIIFFGYRINYQLNPLILLISAIPALVSGIALRFRPLIWGGVLFWAFGITGFVVPIGSQNLVGAVAVLCGFLIPGYLLKNKQQD
jgi:hypothetical protein